MTTARAPLRAKRPAIASATVVTPAPRREPTMAIVSASVSPCAEASLRTQS